MTQIHIIDRQTDTVLEDIQADEFWDELRTRDLNGLDTFDFVTFADKEFSQYLKGEKGLIIPAREGGYAEFIIKENKQTANRDRYIFSEGSFIEIAKKKIIEPGTYVGTPQQLINETMNGIAKWKVGNVAYATVRTIQVEERITAYQMLKRIDSAFEYELKFRFEVDKGNITRFVDLVEKIGSYRGHEIELGHNLESIERHENTRDIVTALNVFGPPDENGIRKYVFVYDDEAKARWSTDEEHLVEDYYPETLDQDITDERLTTLGENELAKRVNAIVTYRVKQVDLEKEIGEDVHFGDEVRSKDEKFNPPLYLEGRIHTMREDLKGIVPTDLEFGDFVELTVEEAFSNFRKLQEEMAKKVSEAQLVGYAEKIIPEQPTAPDPNEHPKWVDTSKNPPQLMLWDGENWTAVKGEKGEDGVTTYTWRKYADDENGNGMADSPEGKRYLGLAFNKTTPTGNNNPSDYTWSPLYDNVKVGGRNLLQNSTWNLGSENWEGAWNNTYQILSPESDKSTSHILQLTSASSTSQKPNIPFLVEVGKEYTVSVDIKVDEVINSTSNLFGIRTFASSDLTNSQANSTSTWYPFKQKDIQVAGEWVRLSFTFKADDKWLRVMPYNQEVGKKVYFREIMVDQSNIEVGWSPAPEEIDQSIEEAKQEAQNAQSTADGKNTAFYQDNAPSTTGRKENDLWFKTNEGFKMHRFDGSKWVATLLGSAAFDTIDVGKLTSGSIVGKVFEGGTFSGSTFIAEKSGSDLRGTWRKITKMDGEGLEISYLASELGTAALVTKLLEGKFVTGLDDGAFTELLSITRNIIKAAGQLTIDSPIINFSGGNEILFKDGPSIDVTGGSVRLKQSDSNYITMNTAGSLVIYAGGTQRHAFWNDGTKSGGTIEVDGKNLGMSPIDSPQILIEYIEFGVPLSLDGVKIYLDETYLKTVEKFAAFPNNGTVIEKGTDYIIIAGEGIADIRFVGERVNYAGAFFADMDEEVTTANE